MIRTTVHLCGVGGQALPLIVAMLGRRAADARAVLTTREVFGMAQRGGSVFATLDIETKVQTDSTRPGSLDAMDHCAVLLAFERLEGMRGFSMLRAGEQAFVSTAQIVPPGTWGEAGSGPRYPTVGDVSALAGDLGVMLHWVEATPGAPWRVVQAAIDAGAIPLGSDVGARAV